MNMNFKKTFLMLLLTGSALSAHAESATRCNLGERCNLFHANRIYYPVSVADGTNYYCTIKAADQDKDITVILSPSGDFSFPMQKIAANYDGATISINGKFARPDDPSNRGRINLYNLSLFEDGEVMCNKH